MQAALHLPTWGGDGRCLSLGRGPGDLRLFPWAWSPSWSPPPPPAQDFHGCRAVSTGLLVRHAYVGRTHSLQEADWGFLLGGGPKRPEVLIGRKLAKLGRPAWSREALEGLRAPWRGFPKRWGVSHYWGVQAERSGTVVVSQADQGETPSLRFYDFVAYLV